MAAETGEPAVAFPEGLPSPVTGTLLSPFAALASQVDRGDERRGERFGPPAGEVKNG